MALEPEGGGPGPSGAAASYASDNPVPDALSRIVSAACELAGAESAMVGMIGSRGYLETYFEGGGGAIFPELAELIRRIVDSGAALRLRGIEVPGAGRQAFLGVPLPARGKVFGVLCLTGKAGGGEFSEQDGESISSLASQAGVSLENARLYWEARLRQWQLEAINEISQAVLAGHDVDIVLRLIARRARELSGADLAIVTTPHPGGESLVHRVAEGAFSEQLAGVTFPAQGSISEEVMRGREPLLITDASRGRREGQPIAGLGRIGPALFVPLGVQDRAFGTISVANLIGGRQFSEEDLSLIQAFAASAAVSLDKANTRRDLDRLAVMEDRERIARDLHDGVIQSLFSVGMGLQAIDPSGGTAQVTEALGEAMDGIDAAVRELRNYIFALRPGVLAGWELERALRVLASGFDRGAAEAVLVEIDPEAASVLASRAAELVPAAREAVANAVKHAAASRVALRLAMGSGAAVLEVSDDGRGFDPREASRLGHGVSNLRERASRMGGELRIESNAKGTRVEIRIPLRRAGEWGPGERSWANIASE